MRKYIEIAKIYLKEQLFWRADAFFNMLLAITKIIFAYLLWGIIFDQKEIVAGFTFQSMLSYYVISSFIYQIDLSSEVSKELSSRIRSGTFSKYMVIPINVENYYLAMQVGTLVFYLICDFIAAAAWIAIFHINFVFVDNPVTILYALMCVVLGLLFMFELNYFLGILTFKYQDISTFLMIKDNLVALITGSMIPLVLLPEQIVACMKVFPFYYVTYLPSMLLIGRCKDEAVAGILIMTGWCVAFAIINKIVYPGSLPLVILSLCIIGYGMKAGGFHLSVVNVIGYIFLVIVMTILFYDLEVIIRSLSFFIISTVNITRLEEAGLELCMKIPGVVFHRAFKLLFYIILPYGIIATIPTQCLTNSLSIGGFLFGVGIVTVFTTFALSFWRLGLKHYNSASS